MRHVSASPPLNFARNNVQKVRKYDLRREDKWSFTDPNSPHPPIKFFCGRLSINHKGASHELLRANYRCTKKNATDAAFPASRINKDAAKQCDSLKGGRSNPNYTDDCTEIILCYPNEIGTN